MLIRALLGIRLEPLRRSLRSSDARSALKRSARGWIRDNLPLLGLSRALVRRSGLRRRLYWRANAYPERQRTLLKRAARQAGEAFADRCIEEMQVLDRLDVRAMNIDGYLDVGANIGQNTYSARVAFPESVPVYAFEPSTPCFEKLMAWCGDLPNVHCFALGVGAESGTATFHRSLSSPTSQASTFLPFSDAYKQEFEWARAPTVEESVEVVALDDFFASRNIEPGENLMLHIDVEGFDYQVLQGARRKILPRTRALIIEVTYGLFEGQGSFEEIFDLLRGDFEFRGFLGPLVTGSAGQSLYQDAYFVRRD
jgi:FkbM family methyltransferase